MRDADSILFRRTSLAPGTLSVRFRRVCIGGRSHCRKTKASVTMTNGRGEVTERLKVLASKASVRETVPWVRIPPSPPYLRLYGPKTSFTERSEDIAYTLGPKGLSRGCRVFSSRSI